MDCAETVIPNRLIRTIIIGILLPPVLFLELGYFLTALIVSTAVFLSNSNCTYWIYVIWKTFGRDVRLIAYMLKIICTLKGFVTLNMTVPKRFSKLVQRHPQKTCFYTEEKHWTYQEVFEYSNRIGHTLFEFGVQKGDIVGVMFGDGGGVRHPAFWLGSSYLSAPIALIPPQLKSSALIHTIKTAKVNFLVYTHHLIDVVKEIQDDPEMEHVKLLQYNININVPMLKNAECVSSKLKEASTVPFTKEIGELSYSDTFMYIYTSGTTGLPKAAIITHLRYLFGSAALHRLLNINRNDVIYTPLPLHHMAGCMVGVGQGLVFGTSVVIRNKFSVTHFWTDCIKYKCTVVQYIGETCRFLLKAAEKSENLNPAGPHCIRVMIGNGLRSTLWKPLQQIFKIPKIYEVYAATEGNANLVNISSKEGAVGCIPRLLKFVLPIKLIKCDKLTGEPLRGSDGFCIECKPCEAGLLIGKINYNKKIYTFTGYVDEESTKKKLIHDVFKSDDVYFNTGDILVMDDFGFFYYRDRTGDTFRWRGENVSTTEVENAINKVIGFEANVYGVQVPNIEGKAGMASIVDTDNKLNLNTLLNDLKKVLPPFAIPIFIRIVFHVSITTTFKLVKKDLQMEAFDINRIKDKIYFLDSYSSSYVPLTTELYDDILNGKVKL